jgi:hypothetical protein
MEKITRCLECYCNQEMECHCKYGIQDIKTDMILGEDITFTNNSELYLKITHKNARKIFGKLAKDNYIRIIKFE